MIDVVFQSYTDAPNKGYWDMNMLTKLLQHKLWQPVGAYSFRFHNDLKTVSKDTEGIVFILPARYHTEHYKQINDDLNRFKWVLAIFTSDEESLFDVNQIEHPNIKKWVMTPRAQSGDRQIGEGFPPDASMLARYQYKKTSNYFFSGQITHKRRHMLKSALEASDIKGKFIETEGFTKGLEHWDYYQEMAKAKVVPCPSGPATPDSFRLYEALEAGAVPIADDICPAYETGYWHLIHPDAPFPVLKNYSDLHGYMEDMINRYPEVNNKVFAWWQAYKRKLSYWLTDDIDELRGVSEKAPVNDDFVTVLIPTSPIPSHPKTTIIDETIKTVRTHLPNAEIIVMCDGVRDEQKDQEPVYQEYLQNLLWKCNNKYKNVLPIVFDEHLHQAEMTKRTLELVKTPFILFAEHDTPLTPDLDIDLESIYSALVQGQLNLVRFHFESVIPKEHEHLMLGDIHVKNSDFILTVQWSQRPHIATKAYYERILNNHFSENSRTMIEDVMHGVVQTAYNKHGTIGWQEHRIGIYKPKDHLKRSYHTDGREGDEKFDDRYIP